jgi:hypothetical protein
MWHFGSWTIWKLQASTFGRTCTPSTAARHGPRKFCTSSLFLLSERGTKITSEIGSALRQYFDPATGALSQRVESLLKQDGDLERALRQHVGPGNSTIAKPLEEHLGPLLTVLSPDDAVGLKARIKCMLEDTFEEQQQRILNEFSLDSEDSSLSRLVRKVRESNGDLTSIGGSFFAPEGIQGAAQRPGNDRSYRKCAGGRGWG